jgi:hypothetical protein
VLMEPVPNNMRRRQNVVADAMARPTLVNREHA